MHYYVHRKKSKPIPSKHAVQKHHRSDINKHVGGATKHWQIRKKIIKLCNDAEYVLWDDAGDESNNFIHYWRETKRMQSEPSISYVHFMHEPFQKSTISVVIYPFDYHFIHFTFIRETLFITQMPNGIA